MKVLLTGGSGFIGRNLVEQLPKDILVLAPSSRELDLTDQDAVERYVRSERFDLVIHAANWNPTANSKKDVGMVLENNQKMFFNLARLEDHYGKIIVIGSGAEYDRRFYRPRMKEDHFDRHVPIDQYGYSKYVMAKQVAKMKNAVDLRVFGCFGPYEDWEIRFISNAMCKALYGLPITLRQNVFFDYIWVNDLVRIIDHVARKDMRERHYNACTGQVIDLVSIAHMINELAGTNVPIMVGAEGLKPEYSGDNSRLMGEVGGFQFTPLPVALSSLLEFYKHHLDEIDRDLLLNDKH